MWDRQGGIGSIGNIPGQVGWDGMGGERMGWEGRGGDRMGWDGMGWDGMGWDAVRNVAKFGLGSVLIVVYMGHQDVEEPSSGFRTASTPFKMWYTRCMRTLFMIV